MIYDFIKEIEEAEVGDISLYAERVKYDPVEIVLVDIKTDKVIGDMYQRLAFKRVVKNRDNRLYANKIDTMKQMMYFLAIINIKLYCSY